MTKLVLSMIATASLAFGSATLINGATERVVFESEPSGATVKVNGFPTCKTPCAAELKRSSNIVNIAIEKEGYEDAYLQAPTHWGAGWFILDIVWDLGTTDAMTGAWYEFDQNKYFVELEKKSNWDYNNRHLDNDKLSDIRSFIMIEYHNLRLEYKTNYISNNTSLALSNLLLELYACYDISVCLEFVQGSIKNTKNPVQFLKNIKKKIK